MKIDNKLVEDNLSFQREERRDVKEKQEFIKESDKDAVSSLLFHLYIAKVKREVKEAYEKGDLVQGKDNKTLGYADDNTIFKDYLEDVLNKMDFIFKEHNGISITKPRQR